MTAQKVTAVDGKVEKVVPGVENVTDVPPVNEVVAGNPVPERKKKNRRRGRKKSSSSSSNASSQTVSSGSVSGSPAPSARATAKTTKRSSRDRPVTRGRTTESGPSKRYPSVEALEEVLTDYRKSYVDGNKQKSPVTNAKHERNDQRRFSEADKVLQKLIVACKDSGFEETGQNFVTCPPNFFEKKKLLQLYDKHLKDCYKEACSSEKDRIAAKSFLARSLKPMLSFKIGIVSGVAGSGKSTLIRKLCETTDVMCILANPRLKETDYKGQNKTFTLQDALLSIVPMSADVVFVDEYTLAESAELLLLQRKLRASFIVLFGDVAQGNSNTAKSVEFLQFPVVFRSSNSRRLGKKTAELCKKHGQGFNSISEVEDEIVVTDYVGDADETEKNIAFSKETVDDLKDAGVVASLVSEVQGKEYDSVSLFVRDSDRKHAADSQNRAVALTRHKKKLIIRAEPEIKTEMLNGEFGLPNNPSSHKYDNTKYSYVDSSGSKTE